MPYGCVPDDASGDALPTEKKKAAMSSVPAAAVKKALAFESLMKEAITTINDGREVVWRAGAWRAVSLCRGGLGGSGIYAARPIEYIL